MRALGVLLLFVLWSALCTAWYTCGVKGLCGDDGANAVAAASENAADAEAAADSAGDAANANANADEAASDTADANAIDPAGLVKDKLFFTFGNTEPLMSNPAEYAAAVKQVLSEKAGFVAEIVGRALPSEAAGIGLERAKAVQQFLGLSDAQILLSEKSMSVSDAVLERAKLAPFEGALLRVFEKQRSDFEVETSGENGSAGAVVYFPFGSADAGDREGLKAKLASVASAITGDSKAVITGHTDNTGDPSFNQQLGQQRADFVKAVLVEAGAAAENIATSSAGQSRPIADNATVYGREKNRRADIVIQE